MSNAILAFDLGLKTGWACVEGNVLRTGSFDVSKFYHDTNLHGRRFNAYLCFINEMISNHDPQAVAYEDASFAAQKRVAQAFCWFGFHACLQAACYAQDIPTIGVHTSTYKARAGIKRTDGKNAAVKWCRDRKIYVTTEDEADAVLVLNAVLPDYDVTLDKFNWVR
jgi:hypothetical protein